MPDMQPGHNVVRLDAQTQGEAEGEVRRPEAGITASFVAPVPEHVLPEGTGEIDVAPFHAAFSAGRLAAFAAIRDRPGSLADKPMLPIRLEPEPILGYRAVSSDPVTTIETAMTWSEAGSRPVYDWTFQHVTEPPSRTLISLLELPASPRALPSGRDAIEELSRWTGLSYERLGALLGASRRSVYNWLRGRAMSGTFESRALRLRAVLRPLAERRGPSEIARWLETGTSPPADLVQAERWDDFDARVRDALMPRVAERMALDPAAGAPDTYSAEARQAALAALRTPPPTDQRRRPDWKPREVTGAAPMDDEVE